LLTKDIFQILVDGVIIILKQVLVREENKMAEIYDYSKFWSINIEVSKELASKINPRDIQDVVKNYLKNIDSNENPKIVLTRARENVHNVPFDM
jgi:hypothetical protein